MRRKSERNKANKGTPEKKVEKPTRRITRRRGKASPVNSPEREAPEDNVSSTPYSEEDKDSRPKTEEEDKDSERLGKDVSSSELIKTVLGGAAGAGGGSGGGGGGGGGDEEDGGSVWKVARADASPGEIQKLKLCRQRNISEASSDSSISKKKSNKWPDSGDGGTEEADSADEPVASSQMSAGERAEDPSSSQPGQDSSEEVSDYKENLPETTSANLSDDQTNIDQQADFKENLLQQETTSTSLAETPAYEDNQSSSPANLPTTDQSSLPSYSGDNAVAEQPSGNLPTSQPSDDQENSSQATGFDSITNTAIDSTDTTTTPITPVTTIEPQESVEANSSINDESANANDENTDEAMSTEQSTQISQDSSAEEPVASYENENKEEEEEEEEEEVIKQDSSPQDSYANDETNSEIVVINNETTDIDFDESRKESEKDEEEEGEIRDEVEKEQSPDSARDKESTSRETRSSRRKHSKYRESSPDTPESGEKKTSKTKRKESGLAKVDDEKKNEKKTRSSKLKEDSVSTNVENYSLENNTEKEDILEINEKSDDLNVTISTSKPTKVSLKRSFSNRLSTDAESKKEEGVTKNNTTSESNQNKENHADNEQPDQKCQTKRRRWGTTTTTSTDVAPAFSISTDSLKALVPGAKPLSANEVKLTKDEDDEKEPRARKSKSSGDSESKSDAVSKNDVAKKSDTKTDNHVASRRKIVLVKETPRPKSPSPPEAQATNILLIRNLVRPFTLNQIKELLARTGTIVENGFWMDRIKSKCFVEYANEDQAFETRQALHGVSWPLSNPKKLIVEYATKDDMELARESSKEQPAPKKAADPLIASADLWQQDNWSRDDRPTVVNKITVIREWDLGKEDGQLAVKEKERERKEFEKKKRQRSRSPALEAHLPAPARKFKKKEEEPPTAKLLDDLFRKTKATPCIYWLPLTNEQIAVKEEIRRQHMAEHARRLEEMRRVERGRSRGDVRRRRSPRK